MHETHIGSHEIGGPQAILLDGFALDSQALGASDGATG